MKIALGKRSRIALIVCAALLALVLLALKIAPGFAKDWAVEHSEELIGRKIAVESVSFNPLTFTAEVDGFSLFEPDGETRFVGFDKFRIDLDPLRLLTRTLGVGEIQLAGLYVHVVQDGDRFNFSDILDRFVPAADSAAPADTTAPATIAETTDGLPLFILVRNIALQNGNIIYEDRKVGSRLKLEDFSVSVPEVFLSDKNTDVGVTFKFASGGDLTVKAGMNMATNEFSVGVKLHRFALGVGKPYLADFVTVQDLSGTVDADISVAGNVADPLGATASGTVAVDSVVVTETSGKTIGVARVDVGIAKANLADNEFAVDSVVVDGAWAHFDLLKGGATSVDALLKPNKEAKKEAVDTAAALVAAAPAAAAQEAEKKNAGDSAAAPAKPLKATVGKLLVRNTVFTANDYTLAKPFSYVVTGITVSANDVSLDKPCAVTIGALLPGGGQASVKYTGSPLDIGTMDAYVSVKNVALKNFSNYSHHYTGYPISGGTLAFASENKLRNFAVDSRNTIDVYNIEVADKDPAADPEFLVPMKVGLYLLKDKDDRIQFDVPVKGNLKDPQFSYFKIVWKTVMNLLVKVALSPLKAVGNVASAGAGMVGLDLGGDDEIVIDPASEALTSEQYAKATSMAGALQGGKVKRIVFTQLWNPKKAAGEFRSRKMKREFYKATKGKSALNELDEAEIAEIKDGDDAYKAWAKEHEGEFGADALKAELAAKAEKRNADLLHALRQQAGVTEKNVQAVTAPAPALARHKGKPMYKVSLEIE
ncbi:MAG: DUF748 domain-containing protein [Fibrobacterales bacterium]|nr:DUF748 domain-containing protein [Fibrobacterales bacterium]